MACLLFLMQIVVGNKFAIPYFRLFMDVVNVSFGINNPARKKYLSKVHNGTTKNKMSVFKDMCTNDTWTIDINRAYRNIK